MPEPRAIAEAFSGHRFTEAYDHLADEVVWVLAGSATLVGKSAVVDACESTDRELSDTATEFLRFLVVAGEEAVAVDAVARYTGSDGSVSVVSSADVYEWRDGQIVAITSYTVELDADALGPTSFVGASG